MVLCDGAFTVITVSVMGGRDECVYTQLPYAMGADGGKKKMGVLFVVVWWSPRTKECFSANALNMYSRTARNPSKALPVAENR